MQCLPRLLRPCRRLGSHSHRQIPATMRPWQLRAFSGIPGDQELGDFLDYMERLKNYERLGVPRGAGTDSDDGFDLGRMRRLLHRLGNPHTHFKAVHIAGTKGKGSTAAFLANILREEGYKVGCYTSPHVLTVRERISFGRNADPVSAELLRNCFRLAKEYIDQSINFENGALTHFEVFTALAFLLFSQEKVDIAVIEAGLGGARDATNVIGSTELALSVITSIGKEHLAALGGSLESIAVAKSGIIKQGRPVVTGGPLNIDIEHIILNKASAMNSSGVSAFDAGKSSILKSFGREDERPYQICDITIQIPDKQSFIDLYDVRLHMVGRHQLQNAITATCAALCLRSQGWRISDASIRAGLEQTELPGRSQFLTRKEISKIGLHRVSILVDGAHTEESALGLLEVIRMVGSDGPLALIVAMASDKDHLAFSRILLSGRVPDIVLLTEASIAGGRSRTMSALALKDIWIRAAQDLHIDYTDIGVIASSEAPDYNNCSLSSSHRLMMVACRNAPITASIRVASQLFQTGASDQAGTIVVTGSLHVVSSLLAAVHSDQTFEH